jgi:cytoskeleton protein RodZ
VSEQEFEHARNDGDAEGAPTVGAILRAAREAKGLRVEDVAAALRSRVVQIEALERDDHDIFGGDIYARGFLRSYALHVGIDPARILALHGRDPAFAPNPLANPMPSVRLRRGFPAWAVGVVGLVAVAVVVGAVLLLGGRRVPEVAQPADLPAVAPMPETVTPPPAPAPAPLPEPEPARAPVEVVLTFEGGSWLEVVVDGLASEPGRLVGSGETLRFEAQGEITVRLGNAGGVRVVHNDEDLGPAGRSGQVLTLIYTPDGVTTPSTSSGSAAAVASVAAA